MNALVNAMPINSASARLMLGKYQILTKKYPAAAIVLALLTKNAIYKSASAASPNRSNHSNKEGHTIQESDRLLTTHRHICPMACITNKLANPSIRVNAGVLFDNVQSQGFNRIL
jgi:hypothetical protein